MKRLLFAALGFGLCVALLNAAAAPSVMKLAAEADADEDPGVQDVLYVGQPHPVMLRLKLRVEGKSAFTHYDACMAKYFEFLDRNNNKTLDRNEAAKAPSAPMMLQFFQGNPFLNGRGRPNAAAVPFEEFDTDRDGKVTLEEFKEYYARNGAGPIIMTAGFNPYGNGSDAFSDVVFNLLDTDKDGKLSKQEIENAEKVLLKYDADDNELVTMAELNLSGQATNIRRIAEARLRRQPMTPAVATNMILMSREDSGKRKAGRTALVRELIGKYDKDKDGALSREEIGFSQKLFDSLDRNKDGKLSVLELVKWVDGKSAGDFTLAMRDQGAAMTRKTSRTAMRVPAARQEEMLVSLGSVRIKIVPQTTVIYGRITEDVLLQQFRSLDDEKKGFITRKQVEGNTPQANFFRGLFDMGDRNSDGKLTAAELKALVSTVTAMRGIQISLSIFSTGNGLFQTLDTNGDGQLSLRELRHASRHLAALDANKDGYVSRDEFPQQFQLTVSQGGNGGVVPQQPGMGGPEPVRQRVRGPVWFVKMDRNGDGDVSRSEWLGSKADFDGIDTDRDGLISLEEAEAYDAKMRNKANDD